MVKINNSAYIAVGKIATLPFYTEGPAIDSGGDLFFTTLSGGTILKVDDNNILSQWAQSPCPNGQIVVEGDDHLVCDVILKAIRRFDKSGGFIKNEIEETCAGEPVFSPNDLISDKKGNLYFTDSIRKEGKLCFLGADRKQEILLKDLDYPNGLVISNDGRFLFVAESYQNRILLFDIENRNRHPGHFSIFAELPKHPSGDEQNNLPDGLAIDAKGNLWVAHYGMGGIQQLSAGGEVLDFISTGLPLTSNLIFKDEKTLLVTGGLGEPGPGALITITFT